MKITKVFGYQVLDSRGKPTVAASISLEDGTSHSARVPSGASTGIHEAKELRDHQSHLAERFFGGNSVHAAIENINTRIAPEILGLAADLELIDQKLIDLDPSPDHSSLGANATLAVSLAATMASAHSSHLSLVRSFQPDGNLLLPMPMVNILSGGAHANRTLDIQDVLVIPVGAQSFTEAISWIVAIREAAARLGREAGKVTHLVADEGGLGIAFETMEDACIFVMDAIESVGLDVGIDVALALDVAATQFFHDGRYHLRTEGQTYSSQDFVDYLNGLVSNLPIVSIEDPFAEDDWESWTAFSSIAPKDLQILGDDLLTTSASRLKNAISTQAANAILIKANQNGLVSETQKVLKIAQSHNFATVVSARSGETEDSWLADLATGWRAGQIKVGSTHGSERNAKWNRLLELEATENTEFSRPF